MKNEFDSFLKSINELEKIIKICQSLNLKNDQDIEVFNNFYFNNIIINAYTSFEIYLKNCCNIIIAKLASLEEIEKKYINKTLQEEIIKKNINRLSNFQNNKIFSNEHIKLSNLLYASYNKEVFKLNESDFIIDKNMPHDINEIESRLTKFFNREKILHDIMLFDFKETVLGISVDNQITAFSLLSKIANKYRHPIVHEGIKIQEQYKDEISPKYIQLLLKNYITIAEELNYIFSTYYIEIDLLKYNIQEKNHIYKSDNNTSKENEFLEIT